MTEIPVHRVLAELTLNCRNS